MSLALLTDLYELTMMAGYFTAGFMPAATFELYVRELPPNRSFLIAAGLEQALDYLEHLRFTEADVEHLRTVPALRRVRSDFFDEYLPRFRFTGEVWAVEEGTPVFPPAPLLRVTAPLPEAQLVETALLAHIGFQTSVASRAPGLFTRHRDGPSWSSVPVERMASKQGSSRRAQRFSAVVRRLPMSKLGDGSAFLCPGRWRIRGSWPCPMSSLRFGSMPAVFGDEAVLLLDTYDTDRSGALNRCVAGCGRDR